MPQRRSLILATSLLSILLAAHGHAKLPSTFARENRYPTDVTLTNNDLWHYWDGLPVGPDLSRISERERAMGSGMALDTAWLRHTTGDFRVRIAVFDSGIKWDERDLINKYFLNAGELPPPNVDPIAAWPGNDAENCLAPNWYQSGGEYDVNHDGIFNIRDYRCDGRVNPQDGVDVADHLLEPSDLIHALHPDFKALAGRDDDRNGFVDDISGWDFFWDDNDPYDDTRFAHGTGEAKGAAAEADNAIGSAGACPDCAVIPVRVGDSFVADDNNLAIGVVFAVDNGARIMQEALGGLNASVAMQAAIDYAYENGAVFIASASDLTSFQHNQPAALEHALMVHAIVPDEASDDWAKHPPSTFLNFSNCTNYGSHLFLSVPSDLCSSGATEYTAGIAGLIYSYAMQLGLDLTANEVMQLLRAGSDDIDLPEASGDPLRFPSQPGWDRYFGYGRINAERSLALLRARAIPPETDLSSPTWFLLIDPSRTPKIPLKGLARARHASSFTYELAVARGIEPRDDAFSQILASGTASNAVTDFGTWDLTKMAFDAAADYGELHSGNARDLPHQFTFTLRLRVTDDRGNRGEFRKAVYLRKDPDLLAAFPLNLRSSGESSPKLADIDGDGEWDIVVALSDGSVHVIGADGKAKRGWPAFTPLRSPFTETAGVKSAAGSPGFQTGKVLPLHQGVIATLAIGNLDGKNLAIVVATLDGAIVAFDRTGKLLPGFPQVIDPVTGEDTDPLQIIDDGYMAAPVLADLNGDTTLEIIAAAMDGKVYVYDYRGQRVSPFPFDARDRSVVDLTDLVDRPNDPSCVAYAQRHSGGGFRSRILGTPSVGDIDGDGKPEIVFGTLEVYPMFCDSDATDLHGSSRLYALRADGSLVPGYPRTLPNQLAVLPYIGRGLPSATALADVNSDGKLDIAVHQIAQGPSGAAAIVDWQGKPLITFKQSKKGSLSNLGVGATRSTLTGLMINMGSFGDMDGDGTPDYLVGAVTIDMLVSQAAQGKRRDFDHVLDGFSGKDGEPLPGFPRVIEDWQLFMNPAVADIDGDEKPEAIQGSGGYTLHAWNAEGKRPRGWPKFTGQWFVASPAVGDINGDGFLEVVANTREGYLYAWQTHGPASREGKNAVQWASFHHDNHNTGNFSHPLPMQPGPQTVSVGCGCDVQASASRGPDVPAALLFFTALSVLWLTTRHKN